MPYPDGYDWQHGPDAAVRRDPLEDEYEGEAARWSEMRDQLNGLVNTIRAMDAGKAVFQDLANRIEDVVSDADGFCALTLFEEGDFHKAAGIWGEYVKRKPTAAELLAGAAPAMAAE